MGRKTLGLALAGLAAYAWYKYAQLSAEEKKELVDNVKDKSKKILDSVKSVKDKVAANGRTYAEGTTY